MERFGGVCNNNPLVGVEELERMKAYASVFRSNAHYYYYIFSKGGFTEGLRDVAAKNEATLVTLEDLYA